jgi:hypothetical protein
MDKSKPKYKARKSGAIKMDEIHDQRMETIKVAKQSKRKELLIKVPNSQPPAWVAVRKNETKAEAIARYNSRVNKFVVDNKNW